MRTRSPASCPAAIAGVVRWVSEAKSPGPWLSHWERWDWTHYRRIAEYGYFGAFPGVDPVSDTRAAFFPGFPLVLCAAHTVVPNWTVAGPLIFLVCGAMAVVALARMAGLGRPDGDGRAGKRAVATRTRPPRPPGLSGTASPRSPSHRTDQPGSARDWSGLDTWQACLGPVQKTIQPMRAFQCRPDCRWATYALCREVPCGSSASRPAVTGAFRLGRPKTYSSMSPSEQS